MAKIRVYELARDLNMTNKEVIEKLNLYGYPITSHTNSIEEEEANDFKQKLKQKAPASMEETRVKPTVIRRRKRAEELAEPHAVGLPEEVIEIKEAEKIDETIAFEETKEEAPHFEELKPEPVEIIKAPEEIAAKTDILKEETAKQIEDAVTVKETLLQVEKKLTETIKEKKIIQAFKDKTEPAAKAPQIEKIDKISVKKRRGKKDVPARIIKLGPASVAPQPPEIKEAEPKPRAPIVSEVKPVEKKPVSPPKQAEVIPISTKLKEFRLKFEAERITKDFVPSYEEEEDEASRDKKKKFGKRRPEESAKDLKFLKRKIPFRKKEVVEGEELYSKENRFRKLQKVEKVKKAVKGLKPLITIPKAIKRRIKIDDTIVISDFAKRIGIKAGEIIKKLLLQGIMATINQAIDFDTAALMASEFNYEVEKASFEEDSILKAVSDDPDKLISRPPVVTVMGHVDHGKTSLLDVVRKTKVTEQEAGGITQHIGAYHVNTDRGQIVFLDTPGHEAFTAMRSRGASITDIVVLVVAADDGVMPQTIEAINHSRAADVPIIVAINKIDKPDADPDRVQRELVDKGLAPEEWGGDTIFVRVSAKKATGIEDLLEMILLQAELMELKANPAKLAYGHVVEAKLDSGRGPVATVLVQDGTLHAGEPIVCGVHYGKIRALLNDRGQMVESAGPSMPVEIIGLSGVPNAGDEFIVLADEKDAKQVSNFRTQKQREKELARTSKLSLENLFEHMKEGKVKDLNIIIKADVHGSIEALRDSLVKLSNEEVKINIIHSGTGAIAESDVPLAMVSNAIIIGFNVRPNAKIMAQAQEENVDIRYYNIIYNVIQDVQSAIVGMMASTFEEKVLGNAEVREVFHIPKIGTIAGCYIQNGKIQRGQPARLIREGVVLYDGKISSLRRFKDDVKEVLSGFECGIGIENYNDIKIGDIIECYFMEEIKPEIEKI